MPNPKRDNRTYVTKRPFLREEADPKKPVSKRSAGVRKKTKLVSGKFIVVLAGLCIVAGLGIFYGYQHFLTNADTTYLEDNYFVDSKYDGVRSHIISRQTKYISSFVEVPVTDNKKINSTISQAVHDMNSGFAEATDDQVPRFDGMFSENVSYIVTSANNDYLSIAITGKYDDQGAHPYGLSHAWTFNRRTGQVISLEDLTKHDQTATDILLERLKQSLSDTLGKKNVFLDQVTIKNVPSFAVKDKSTIEFYFSQAGVAPSSAGPVKVDVAIDNRMAGVLKGDIADKLFDIPELPTVNESASSNTQCSKKKCIALTFDDGPGQYTDKLLSILSDNNVKATFFLIGSNVEKYPSLVKQERQFGHAIGNHTWTHPDLTLLSDGDIRSQVEKTNQAIKKADGEEPTMIRPPYGATNKQLSSIMKEMNMSSVFWSVDTRDWSDHDSEIVCNRAIANAYSGSIILMHDIHETTVDAVQCVIDGLKNQGYQLVTVPELIGQLKPGANYYQGHR